MNVLFKSFDSKMASREKLFKAAVEFANKVGKERLINITHSEDRDNVVVTIWYWAEDEIKQERPPKKFPTRQSAIVTGDSPPAAPSPAATAPPALPPNSTPPRTPPMEIELPPPFTDPTRQNRPLDDSW
jgi:hypothetical protein